MEMVNRLKVLQGHLCSPVDVNKGGVCSFPVSGLGVSDQSSLEKFKYTVDRAKYKLSLEQRRFYEKNGYLVVRNLVSHGKLDRYQKRFEDLCRGVVKSPGVTLMKDVSLMKMGVTGERLINKVQDYIFDPVLFNYCQLPEVLDYVECFTSPNIMAMHTMLINKPPDPGTLTSRHPLHQDLQYFPFGPADRVVCAWTAMEPITRENGCLVVLPGTHQGQLLPHELPNWEGGVNIMYYGIEGLTDKDFDARVHLEMNKGDTVFFHPILIHGSGANRTNGYRKAISCHYASSECDYHDFSDDSTSTKMYNEMTNFIAKHTELVIDDVTMIWKARSRLVRGEKINL